VNQGATPAEGATLGWNTLENLALGAGIPQRPVNAIPSNAVAYQLRFGGHRLAPPETIVREHLDANGFNDVVVTIGMGAVLAGSG
jgi:hypothetical protein